MRYTLNTSGLMTKSIWFLRARERGRARARPFPTGSEIDLAINWGFDNFIIFSKPQLIANPSP